MQSRPLGLTDAAVAIFQRCREQLFSDYPNSNSHFKNKDWWLYGNYPDPYRTPLEGNLLSDGSSLSTKSEECLSGLVERMGRFKRSMEILDQLAKLTVVDGRS